MRKKRFWRPALAMLLLVCAAVSIYCLTMQEQDRTLYWLSMTLFAAGLLWLGVEWFFLRRNAMRYIAEMDTALDNTARNVPEHMAVPVVILNDANDIIWYNDSFYNRVAGGMDLFGQQLETVLPIAYQKLVDEGLCETTLLGHSYRVSRTEYERDKRHTQLLCFQDITPYVELRKKYQDSRPCVLLIVIDNFEDLFTGTRQSERATVLAAVENLFEAYLNDMDSVFCRLDEDRFLVVTEAQHYLKMERGRFKLLDEARKIQVGGKTGLTLSIGVGRDGTSFSQNEAYAQQSLDMALGRGGDQAAVKTRSGYTFYGGVSKGVEHKSKTKHRAVAKAMLELMESCNHVYVMGHRFSDLDAVGAAVGVAFIAEQCGKAVNLVMDLGKTLAMPLVEQVLREKPDLILTPEQAQAQFTEDAFLVIVDTFSKDIVESAPLYRMAKHVAVIDHHRKMINFIDNATLNLHDPFASSAAELVTEMIQYLECRDIMPQFCAEALLAGIMLDTKNFVMQTGVHTFEAAAYLRERGADPVTVKGLFAATMSAYRRRSQLVGDAELHGRFAITVAREPMPEMQIVASQTADDLLGIEGVDASFVIFPSGEASCISARSMGLMNVQLVMERLGGGGHQTMAATQRTGCAPTQLRQELLAVLDALEAEQLATDHTGEDAEEETIPTTTVESSKEAS